MPQLKHRPETEHVTPMRAVPKRSLFEVRASSDHFAAPSPALALQGELAGRLAASELAERTDKWSARRTLGFIGLTCGGAWTALALIIVSLK